MTEEVGFGETSSGAVVADGTRLSSGARKPYLARLNDHRPDLLLAAIVGVAFGKQGRYGGTSQELTESAGQFQP